MRKQKTGLFLEVTRENDGYNPTLWSCTYFLSFRFPDARRSLVLYWVEDPMKGIHDVKQTTFNRIPYNSNLDIRYVKDIFDNWARRRRNYEFKVCVMPVFNKTFTEVVAHAVGAYGSTDLVVFDTYEAALEHWSMIGTEL